MCCLLIVLFKWKLWLIANSLNFTVDAAVVYIGTNIKDLGDMKVRWSIEMIPLSEWT